MNAKKTPDAYASEIAKTLVTEHGLKPKQAIALVHEKEAFVRKSYRQGVWHGFVARKLAGPGARLPAHVGRAVTRGEGRGAGLSEGQLCFNSKTWVPPVFVSPSVYEELRHNATPSTASAPGHIFGKRKAAGPRNIAPGVVRNKDGTSWTRGGALYVSASNNSKTGAVDVTWVSIQHTCVDCKLKEDDVCYADKGHGTQFTVRRMERQAGNETADEVALDEAACIDSSYDGGKVPEGRVLRLHGSGDTSTKAGAHALGAAVGRWKQRGGVTAYSYTHAWRRVSRADFGPNVSVLASLDYLEDARAALAAGYGSVTAVFLHEEWAQNWVITKDGSFVFKVFTSEKSGTSLKWLPCPAQYPHDSEEKDESKKSTGRVIPGNAARWKRHLVGQRLGLDEKKIAKLRTEGIIALMKEIDARDSSELNKRGLPSPSRNPEAFGKLFRLIPKEEAATCDSCKQCFNDQALGRVGRAIAFKPDHSGGAQKTQEKLRERTKAVVRLAVVQ